MCGIAGFYTFQSLSDTVFQEISNSVLKSMKHRGPDDEGFWVNNSNNIMLCQVRLSILDLSIKGHQPMHSKNGRLTMVFNGEIYNHKEIRKKLVLDGCSIAWEGESDTETLLESLVFWGIEKTLSACVGMFSFAYLDLECNKLILARDRFGEKPLYWGWQNDKFYFASELSSISCNPYFKSKINRSALNQLVRYNYIPAPNSIFQNIFKLLPGHFLSIDFNQPDIEHRSKPYWSLIDKVSELKSQNKNITKKDALKLLDDKLSQVIKNQMLSDVPIGAFLSGGIDSSMIASLMQKNSITPIKTYTIGFSNLKFNEAVYAKDIANHIGTQHNELYINDLDVINLVSKMPFYYSEPFADSSQIPTFLLCEMVSKHVKVALSGDAGDELFGGYNQYLFTPKLWRIANIVPFNIRKLSSKLLNHFDFSNKKIEKIIQLLPAKNEIDFYKRMVSHWNDPDKIVLESDESYSYLNNFVKLNNNFSYQENLMIFDSLSYLTDDILVKVDRAAMANSLETRVPFLDHEFFELVWSLPLNLKIQNNSGKKILKELLEKYVPKNLIDRPKQGFALPLGQWLRGPLRDWADELLSNKRLIDEGYFNSVIIRRVWNEHLSGKKDNSLKLWSVLMFQSWYEVNKSVISK
jgi:asparagine synthase (glutamine-hydrolysing)